MLLKVQTESLESLICELLSNFRINFQLSPNPHPEWIGMKSILFSQKNCRKPCFFFLELSKMYEPSESKNPTEKRKKSKRDDKKSKYNRKFHECGLKSHLRGN